MNMTKMTHTIENSHFYIGRGGGGWPIICRMSFVTMAAPSSVGEDRHKFRREI